MWKYDVRWITDDVTPSLISEVQQVCFDCVVKANVLYPRGNIKQHYNEKYNGTTDQTVYQGVLCDDLVTISIRIHFFTKGAYQQLIARCVVNWQTVNDQVSF